LLGADPAALAASDNQARALTALTDPDAAAVSQAAAIRLGTAPGDTLRLTFADGATAPLRIAAVSPDKVVPADLLADGATLRAQRPGRPGLGGSVARSSARRLGLCRLDVGGAARPTAGRVWRPVLGGAARSPASRV
jgi:hypothetical protein